MSVGGGSVLWGEARGGGEASGRGGDEEEEEAESSGGCGGEHWGVMGRGPGGMGFAEPSWLRGVG